MISGGEYDPKVQKLITQLESDLGHIVRTQSHQTLDKMDDVQVSRCYICNCCNRYPGFSISNLL